jgi:hypothetical protein
MFALLPASAEAVAIGLFALTYAGMALGRLPGLKIDRTGIALLAAVFSMAKRCAARSTCPRWRSCSA